MQFHIKLDQLPRINLITLFFATSYYFCWTDLLLYVGVLMI